MKIKSGKFEIAETENENYLIVTLVDDTVEPQEVEFWGKQLTIPAGQESSVYNTLRHHGYTDSVDLTNDVKRIKAILANEAKMTADNNADPIA